jgi:excisionase family DNA binding protein
MPGSRPSPSRSGSRRPRRSAADSRHRAGRSPPKGRKPRAWPIPRPPTRAAAGTCPGTGTGCSPDTAPARQTLTPTEAAELLGLSRPFVARLLERGDIPSELLPGSRHRRVKLEDVLAFQGRRERRSEGRSSIADIAAAADLPHLCLLFVARVFIDRVRPVSVLCHGSHARPNPRMGSTT